MKPFIAGAAAVAVGSLSLLTGCSDSTRLEASAPRSLDAAAPDAAASLLVQCGEGRQALVRTIQINGRTLPQVECVAVASSADLVGYAQPIAQTAAYRQPLLPVIDPAPARVVYRDRPVRRAAAQREAVPQREVRSWKKSALIIGGAAAGGAGVGAVIDGGKGAKKGAVIGGVAGTIYDLATRARR